VKISGSTQAWFALDLLLHNCRYIY